MNVRRTTQPHSPPSIKEEALDERSIRIAAAALRVINCNAEVHLAQTATEEERSDTLPPEAPTTRYIRTSCKMVDGLPEGPGRVFFKCGCIYAGNVNQGKLDGKGMLVRPDETVYHGHFENGGFDPTREMNVSYPRFSLRRTYKGLVDRQGLPQGNGCMTYNTGNTGRVLVGRFVNGQFVPQSE